ncbi:MAG: Asp-tRNA(Asn)/Glu-tRNA(Gln) amidotransferase subunit GatA [Tissierellia bacterium]|nr:Asp-tRNA(Asn)/Glu-tRNA(Gln) amidotransferase subunit GatA [Tissierellia bacterium]
MDILDYSAVDLSKAVKEKEISATEVVRAYSLRIKEVDKDINAYISLSEDVFKDAEVIDKKISAGESVGDMAGVPVAVKDNIMTRNLRSTCGSKILENFVPPYDATVVEKLKRNDALIIGKTNMDEFAVGGSNENSYFGFVRNPVDKERVPGGSSGGSAAAVTAKEALVALGSDTGGSIRQPASFCGIVGIKPTYGMVSRFGVASMANTLDQVGTFGRDVRDTFYTLRSISGFDERDLTSFDANISIDFTKSLEESYEESMEWIRGKKIAIPEEYFIEGLNPQINSLIMQVVDMYEEMGAIVESVNFPHLEYALPAYYAIAPSELSSNLARFDGIRYGNRVEEYEDIDEMFEKTRDDGFGEEVKRRIILGTMCTQGGFNKNFYGKALKARTLIVEDMTKIFDDYDLIISPTTPTTAFKIGERKADPMSMYLADVFTVPLNLAGNCGISIPCGEVDGLPLGFQLMAERFEDEKLYYAGMAYEGVMRNVL